MTIAGLIRKMCFSFWRMVKKKLEKYLNWKEMKWEIKSEKQMNCARSFEISEAYFIPYLWAIIIYKSSLDGPNVLRLSTKNLQTNFSNRFDLISHNNRSFYSNWFSIHSIGQLWAL